MNTTNLIFLDNNELTRFLFAIILLLSSAHLFAYIFQRLKLPRVVGEIVGGILLGPSILGFFRPEIYKGLFMAFEAEGKLIASIYWLGLVLLMFISGFELQRNIDKADRKIILVLCGAIILPFGVGGAVPMIYDFTRFFGPQQNFLALQIILAISFSVTSIPVISKIFIDLGIIETRFAKVVLATATIHDIILWVALAIGTGVISKAGVPIYSIFSTVIFNLLFFFFSLFIMPKIVQYATRNRLNLLAKSSLDGYTLFLCLSFAAVASILEVNIIFGAFLAGVITGTLPNDQFAEVKANVKRFSLAFFIPIYFSVVGLKLDLVHHFEPMLFLSFMAVSSFFLMGSTFLAAKSTKLGNISCLNLAVAMNARGGPGIVVATIAFDSGIINEVLFVAMVLVAITTSLIAGWWFRFVLSRQYPLLS